MDSYKSLNDTWITVPIRTPSFANRLSFREQDAARTLCPLKEHLQFSLLHLSHPSQETAPLDIPPTPQPFSNVVLHLAGITEREVDTIFYLLMDLFCLRSFPKASAPTVRRLFP